MTSISVPFQEHEDSPSESGSRSGQFQFERIFITDYADRWIFLTEMFTGGLLGLPKAYSAEWPGLLCSDFEIDRVVNKVSAPVQMTDPETEWVTHRTNAVITIQYAPLEIDGSEDTPSGTFATYEMGESVEFSGHPGRRMKWETSGKFIPPDIMPVNPVPATRHIVTWSQVKDPPYGSIRNMKGFVNVAPFYIPASGQTIEPEHLLFAESTSRSIMGYDGKVKKELTLVFLEKNQAAFAGGSRYGWNHQWDPEEQTYDRIVDEFGNTQFPTGSWDPYSDETAESIPIA